MKRYVDPLIRDIPTTDKRMNEFREKEEQYFRITIIDNNHTIINGHVVTEGCRPPFETNKHVAVKRTVETVTRILNDYNHPLIRIKPEMSYGSIYMRIITERKENHA